MRSCETSSATKILRFARTAQLRRARFLPFLVVLDRGRRFRAFDQILDRDFALGALVGALNDDARAVALVGVFHLRLHAGRAEIHFGADAGVAQRLRHFLIAGDFRFIHHEHDHGTERRLRLCADEGERRLQTRDADREAGCWNFLAREAATRSS